MCAPYSSAENRHVPRLVNADALLSSDMSTANRFFGTGGLDASLQFELKSSENTGPGHETTLKFYANYLSSRSSMADLIAAGVYASVRACGGPIIPLRLGRRDAVEAG